MSANEPKVRYKYEPGKGEGFIILRYGGTGEPGAWEDHGWYEIGEWWETEEEAKEAVAKLEAPNGE